MKRLKAEKSAMQVGKTVTYTIARGSHGKTKEVALTLAKIPDEVLAQWIGSHMLDHAAIEIAQK